MSLVGRRPPVQTTGYPCSVATLLQELPEDERDALQSMLDDPRWSGTQIWDALQDEGYTVGKQTVSRHRRRSCRCGKVIR